jgi:hypothetical protein
MELTLYRYDFKPKYAQGLLFLNGEFFCDTIEDTVRELGAKVPGETAIPYGRFKIELRKIGKMTRKYKRRFPAIHKGMLWLRNVLNFKYIYIHVGNKPEDSLGCILVGEKSAPGLVGNSNETYAKLYPILTEAMESGEEVYITIVKGIHLMPAMFFPRW